MVWKRARDTSVCTKGFKWHFSRYTYRGKLPPSWKVLLFSLFFLFPVVKQWIVICQNLKLIRPTFHSLVLLKCLMLASMRGRRVEVFQLQRESLQLTTNTTNVIARPHICRAIEPLTRHGLVFDYHYHPSLLLVHKCTSPNKWQACVSQPFDEIPDKPSMPPKKNRDNPTQAPVFLCETYSACHITDSG